MEEKTPLTPELVTGLLGRPIYSSGSDKVWGIPDVDLSIEYRIWFFLVNDKGYVCEIKSLERLKLILEVLKDE